MLQLCTLFSRLVELIIVVNHIWYNEIREAECEQWNEVLSQLTNRNTLSLFLIGNIG